MAGHYWLTVQDNVTGRPVANATLKVYLSTATVSGSDVTGTLATIYSDNGVTAVNQSGGTFLTTNSRGFVEFWTDETTVVLAALVNGVAKWAVKDVPVISADGAANIALIESVVSDVEALNDSFGPNSSNTAFYADFVDDVYSVGGTTVADFNAFMAALGTATGQTCSFTRAGSIGYYTDATGALVTAATNVPRITYDEVTGAKLGLLYEAARTQLFQSSYIRSGVTAPWNFGSSTNITITGEAATGPLGANTAGTIREVASATVHGGWFYDAGAAITAGQTYTVQFYRKAVSRTYERVTFIGNVGGMPNGGVLEIDYTNKAVTGGWDVFERLDGYLHIVGTFVAVNSATLSWQYNVLGDAYENLYTGSTSKGLNFGPIQCEIGQPSSYIHSAGVSTSRSADVFALPIPTGETKLSVVFDDGSFQVINVSAGAYTLTTSLNRSIIRRVFTGDYTDYAKVDGIVEANGTAVAGNVQIEQANVKGLRTKDSPTLYGAYVTGGRIDYPDAHIYTRGAFYDWSGNALSAFTSTPRGLRLGYRAGAAMVTFSNALVAGTDAALVATSVATSEVIGDTAAAAASSVAGSFVGGNEAGNGLSTIGASIILGNKAQGDATSKAASNGVAVGQLALRYNGSADTVAVGWSAGQGNSSNKGTLTNHVLIGSGAGSTLEGSRTGNVLIGKDAAAPTTTTDNYLNLAGALKGSLTGGAYTLTKADGSVATLKYGVTTVSGLPSAATVGAGTRAFVTDANATTFASTVAGGGANNVPVYSDGTNWKIG